MHFTASTTTVLLSALSLVQAQTFTDCNPTKKSCPADPALGKTLTTDFTKGRSSDWAYADGTSMTYDQTNGAVFSMSQPLEAPTISSQKYIFFGKVSATIKSSPGVGIISSFILESDDLDEIDWEWLGAADGDVQTNFFGKGDTSTYDRSTTVAVSTPIESWHTYTIDWKSDRIIWSIDNNPVRTLAYTDPHTIGGTRYPQTPMKIKMGNWNGCPNATDPATVGTCQWAGGQSVFNSDTNYQMFVKTVTIEDYGCGTEYTYGDLTGDWQSIKTTGNCGGSSSGSSSPSGSAAASSTGTKSGGGVFAQTSTTSSGASSSATGEAKTLTTSTSANQPSNTTPAGTTPDDTSASTPTPSTNNGNSSKSKYGVLDYAVIALGLGLGYLVM